jgi:glycosyltransferase involved in cell wall biosynthesis
MPKVSVIVPVFDPGSDIDDLIASLLGQTLPAAELELIFVDDGSTDGTPARLDALADQHRHVRVQHIPNSGWPGRPRNVGLDMAGGDYVFFADNDDWLERDGLERLYETAVQDRADVVVGKVVGHGKAVPRGLFERNRHGERFDTDVFLQLLAPHKLFRRGLLDEHGIRFPEGKRRLEDHPFVLSAYFAAERISVVADHPIYHWVAREGANASAGRFDAEGYFQNVREVLDLVEARTEPGPWRDRLMLHWYRGKMLGRVGGRAWAGGSQDWRRELYESIRALALERYGEDVHEHLPFNLRLRSKLLRAGGFDALERLSRYERRLQPVVHVRGIERAGTHLVLRLDAHLGGPKTNLRFERTGNRTFWAPPGDPLRDDVAEADREVTGELRRSTVEVTMRSLDDGSEYLLPARTGVTLPRGREGRIRPRLQASVPIAPTAAAAGGPLPSGRWELRATVTVAGFSGTTTIERGGEPLVVTTYPPGRIVVGDAVPPPPPLATRVYRRLPPAVMHGVRRTRARAVSARRG